MLPRLRAVAEANPEGTVQFVDRGAFTAQRVVDELEAEMDILFQHLHLDL